MSPGLAPASLSAMCWMACACSMNCGGSLPSTRCQSILVDRTFRQQLHLCSAVSSNCRCGRQ
eukprot:12630770-Prorocentrum_lima.AAC.1